MRYENRCVLNFLQSRQFNDNIQYMSTSKGQRITIWYPKHPYALFFGKRLKDPCGPCNITRPTNISYVFLVIFLVSDPYFKTLTYYKYRRSYRYARPAQSTAANLWNRYLQDCCHSYRPYCRILPNPHAPNTRRIWTDYAISNSGQKRSGTVLENILVYRTTKPLKNEDHSIWRVCSAPSQLFVRGNRQKSSLWYPFSKIH